MTQDQDYVVWEDTLAGQQFAALAEELETLRAQKKEAVDTIVQLQKDIQLREARVATLELRLREGESASTREIERYRAIVDRLLDRED